MADDDAIELKKAFAARFTLPTLAKNAGMGHPTNLAEPAPSRFASARMHSSI